MATATQDDDTDEVEVLKDLLGPTGPQPVVRGFDTAALHLLRLQPENLFERMSADPASALGTLYRCKGCREERIPRSKFTKHRDRHLRAQARGDYNVGGGTMATTAKQDKPAKITAKDQGFPAAYLAENGNFKPGLDARAKSDLVAAVLGLDTKDALHKFDSADAARLLKARGWEGYVEKKRQSIAAAEARKAAAAVKKTEAAKQAATAKSTGTPAKSGQAKPDPKKPAAKKPAGRRVGGRSSGRSK